MARVDFKNILTIKTFITHRVWKYSGKTFNLHENQYQKKMLGGWIHNSITPRKLGQPQICSSTLSSPPSKMLYLLSTKTESSANGN